MSIESLEAGTKKDIFSFVGPEGSGKSTLARSFAEKHNVPIFSIGDEFRRVANEEPDTELGRRCQEMLDKNLYSDRDLFTKVVDKGLEREGFRTNIVLDGAFRASWQLDVLKELLERHIGAVDFRVVFLRTSVWKSMERLLERNRGDDDLKRLGYFYKDLGPRMSMLRKEAAQFIIIETNSKSPEDLSIEIDSKVYILENVNVHN